MELREDVRAFLEEPRFAVLATANEDGSPQQTVMWYELRGDIVMMNTRRGRKKDRNLLRNPRASLCIEDGFRYVTLDGTIAMIEDQRVAHDDIVALALRYQRAAGVDDPAEAERMAREEFGKQERITLHLAIDRVDVHGFDDEA